MEHWDEVETIFSNLVQDLYENLPDFGQTVSIDGKIIETYAGKKPSDWKPTAKQLKEGRADTDAKYTVKTRPLKNGTIKNYHFYGYRIHLLCDCQYELPITFKVTPANQSEQKVAKTMLSELPINVIERMKNFLADAGYDDTALHELLKSKSVLPFIDKRNTWKDPNQTRQYKDMDLFYDQKGRVFYVNDKGESVELKYAGYDRTTDSQRYTFHPKYHDKRVFRMKCSEDLRIFTPVARTSKKYKRIYKQRTAVERLNGRLDRDFKFETYTIRGLEKMALRVIMSFIILLTFAKAKLSNQDQAHLASWVA
ncbi:transposase [Streptococcus pluranimalium]|uniref:transposase n=1 Tax=Streptococcus pluranimalium TaxID=82348 RepID=UPI003F692426